MATAVVTGAEAQRWDLSPLYLSRDDPKLSADLEWVLAEANRLRERYRGRIAALTPSEMAEALAAFEELTDRVERLGAFAYLDFSIDTADPARGALLQKVEERGSAVETETVFFRVEWTEVTEEAAARLVAAPELSRYRHFLESARRYRPHTLSESEERVLQEKSTTARNAWTRLFTENIGQVRVTLDGEPIGLEVALSKLHEPDREVRRAAAAAVTTAIRDDLRTRSFILNTLLLDKATDDRLRNYPGWISARNLANEAPDESVQALIDAVTGRYDICARYYRLKRRMLGLPELFEWDRYAPLAADSEQVEWDTARDMVLDSFDSFSPEMAAVARRFFDERWIDAPVLPNKRGGAYSHPTAVSAHPYVMLNYTGQRRDVLTLAHELGHGVHQVLAARQGTFNAPTPLTLAETASVFGETVLFNRMVAAESNPGARLNLIAGRLEDEFATIFRQVSMNRFEDRIHNERREAGELSSDRVAQLWMETQRPMFGDSVTLTDDYSCWWSYIPHFIDVPGYVYAYAYGNLLALAVYRRYEQEGPAYVPHYLDLLAAGGSDRPDRLAARAGINLGDPAFWSDGLRSLETLLDEAERLAKEVYPG
ncbi:MAG: M3 family oligoendopeptidase [Candidatus Dormibacteria bacterium]